MSNSWNARGSHFGAAWETLWGSDEEDMVTYEGPGSVPAVHVSTSWRRHP